MHAFKAHESRERDADQVWSRILDGRWAAPLTRPVGLSGEASPHLSEEDKDQSSPPGRKGKGGGEVTAEHAPRRVPGNSAPSVNVPGFWNSLPSWILKGRAPFAAYLSIPGVALPGSVP